MLSRKESFAAGVKNRFGHTQVRLIDIFDPVCDDGIRNDEKVKLDNEPPLLRTVIFCIPVVPSSSLTLGMHIELRQKHILPKYRKIIITTLINRL
jgi:hypothetical protein